VSDISEYEVNVDGGRALLSGVMRLESVESYARVLAPVRSAMAASVEAFELDTTELVFLNSSGIRALGELVLFARAQKKGLVIVGTASVPWQRKTFASLQNVYDRVEVRLR
jgi:hypothetical protein